MSLKASFEKRIFEFKRPSGTSRGVLTEKKAWFITVWDEGNPKIKGVGECSVIPNLSPDYPNDESYEAKVKSVVEDINFYADNIEELQSFPSIYFGVEMALLDLKNGGMGIFYDTDFTKGKQAIPINGLIWMGDEEFMQSQITQKLEEGFSCIKMKIGAIDFEKELEILAGIRKQVSAKEITLRVDANGAFSPEEAPEKLKRLSEFELHSIEQPIKQGQITAMQQLCAQNILPIALDEELIGVYDYADKAKLLDDIQPQYIILKPSLIGGFKGTKEWIELAEEREIPWWITSALESNVGLDAIAQFTSTYDVTLPQGLGTGALYTNNVANNLVVSNGELFKQNR
ncbi:o-succinylbenzoate synthase [Brumimicrobium salinarum]|uniref:O-succinylbenzoate synthase n=1 Tax=Brumimicrobium salinarum TaxID=2058658 RepID=A0A2I0R0Y1_9FLAO|nr:o-succinylbenzoate synthase [Brumimicrobium salinarum]PKR80050.1 o-succinylbenzoate synthase [Brumimicrobium salinarum]